MDSELVRPTLQYLLPARLAWSTCAVRDQRLNAKNRHAHHILLPFHKLKMLRMFLGFRRGVNEF